MLLETNFLYISARWQLVLGGVEVVLTGTLQNRSPTNGAATSVGNRNQQKIHFYAFLNCDFESMNQRTVAELVEQWNVKVKDWFKSPWILMHFMIFFLLFFIFQCKTDKKHYSVKKCIFSNFFGGIRFFVVTRDANQISLSYC